MKRLVSLVLLAAGIALVFGGFNAALGFTVLGSLASITAIVTLLYAGASWFGGATSRAPAPSNDIFVFDRALRVVCGAGRGAPLLTQFPPSLHAEIQTRCLAALAGQAGRFAGGAGSSRVSFDAVPVRGEDGSVIFGMLVSAAAAAPGDAVGSGRP